MTSLFKQEEKAAYALRELYLRHGYAQFKMSKFEAYDLYAKNKEFLVSDGVITFTDTDGTLMALKPDVTLSIVKNYRREPGCVQKVYYNEHVYRAAGAGRGYREIMQTGLECLGEIGLYELSEVVLLAAKSLQAISGAFILDLSHMGILAECLNGLPLSYEEKEAVLRCIGEKNEDGLRDCCGSLSDGQLERLCALIRICGPIDQALGQLEALASPSAFRTLETVSAAVRHAGLASHVHLDFSLVCNQKYYNGLVFRGYVDGIPNSILSGGQYDKLMTKMGKQAGGVGFAVYLDQLERLDAGMKTYDVDTVLLYRDGEDVPELQQAADRLRADGGQILTVRRTPEQLRYRRLLRYQNGRIELIEDNG